MDRPCEGEGERRGRRVGVISLYFWPAVAFGGPVFANRDLCRALVSKGLEVRVVTSDAGTGGATSAGSEWVETDPGVVVKYCRGVRGGLFAPGMLVASGRLVRQVDSVYVWGLFVWVLPFVLFVCRLRGVRLVLAPGGMLSEEALRVRPLRKRLFLRLLKVMRVESRVEFHATSSVEGRDIAREIPGSRVQVVPHGVDVPPARVAPEPGSARDEERPYFLVLGRLDPHKQVGRVIEAFAKALGQESGEDGRRGAAKQRWALWIAGSDTGDQRQELEGVARGKRQEETVRFLGEVYGDEKGALVSGASFLVSGSRSENFGLGIAEALARSVPVIASHGCPWPELDARGCGWWVDDSVESLAAALRRAMATGKSERERMGECGREWMKTDFDWDRVGGRMERLLLGSGPGATEETRRVGDARGE